MASRSQMIRLFTRFYAHHTTDYKHSSDEENFSLKELIRKKSAKQGSSGEERLNIVSKQHEISPYLMELGKKFSLMFQSKNYQWPN